MLIFLKFKNILSRRVKVDNAFRKYARGIRGFPSRAV